MGSPQTALRNKYTAVPRVGPGTQLVPSERQVSSLGLTWPKRKEGPVSHAPMRNLDAENKEEVGGNGASGRAGEEMPPDLAFASDLLLNKHISGLRVKYIGLQ